jgi:hypothetical protein
LRDYEARGDLHEGTRVNRLGDVLVEASGQGTDAIFDASERRHGDDRQITNWGARYCGDAR